MTLEIESQPQHPPFPPHPHRLASTCDRHPDEQVTGFCASCLRERLAVLDTSATSSSAAPRRKSTSSAAPSSLKSIFFKPNSTSNSSLLRPELRRCKSFSAARGDRSSAAFEPQRKSCDVRGRNTLWSLFHQDDRDRVGTRDLFPTSSSSAAAAAAGGEIETECRTHLGFPPSIIAAPLIEEERDGGDEIRPVDPVVALGTSGEIEGGEEEPELKPMKDHIDLDSQVKRPPPKDRGSFWLAASVFSKKLQKWRRKQKPKKHDSAALKADAGIRPGKPPRSCRRFRDTQSEIAVDAFGRRSCDTDPRFSLDAGRISFDDPRYSWDEPRASWDGYLIGSRSVFPRLPPMLSVVEDVPVPAPAVQRSDGQIPVEEDSTTPGGSAQTRDYYSDSSSRHRWSLDRSSSVKTSTAEVNDSKPVSNAKVSPAGGTEFFHLHHGGKLDRDWRDWSSNSLRDDRSESFESAYRDSHKIPSGKKSRRWSKAWNIWGFINRRSSGRGGANVVERSFSESWPELRANGYNGKIFRSNSSVSSRSSFSGNGGFGSMRRSSLETNGHGKKRREEFVLERNRSARFSPSHIDNGLLRFYLTPMRSSRRKGGSGKSSHNSSYNSFTKSVLRMY